MDRKQNFITWRVFVIVSMISLYLIQRGPMAKLLLGKFHSFQVSLKWKRTWTSIEVVEKCPLK